MPTYEYTVEGVFRKSFLVETPDLTIGQHAIETMAVELFDEDSFDIMDLTEQRVVTCNLSPRIDGRPVFSVRRVRLNRDTKAKEHTRLGAPILEGKIDPETIVVPNDMVGYVYVDISGLSLLVHFADTLFMDRAVWDIPRDAIEWVD